MKTKQIFLASALAVAISAVLTATPVLSRAASDDEQLLVAGAAGSETAAPEFR